MSVILKSVRHSGLLACAGLAGLLLASPAAFAQAPPPLTTSSMNCTTTQVLDPGHDQQHRHPCDPRKRRERRHFGCDRQRQYGLPHPTRQRLRFGAGKSRARSAGRRRVGARRRRSGRPQRPHRDPSAFRPRAAPSSIPATTNCNNQQRQTFAGAQVGADIARLNYAGWNLHLGTTAGYLGSRTTDNAGLRQRFRSPLLGHLLRRHQRTLLRRRDGSPGVLQYQPEQPGLSPSATSRSGPTAGRSRHRRATTSIWARAGSLNRRPASSIRRPRSTRFTAPGVAGTNFTGITGVIQTGDVTSQIGRASVRVGKAIATPNVIWQPFASASVFHEFAGDVRSNYTSLNGDVLGAALYVQPGHDDIPRRHLWPVLARPRRADREHGLARLRARRLS